MLIRRVVSISNFHTGFDAATHNTLDAEQFTSHTRTALVDTFAFLQVSSGEVIPVLEIYGLLTNIHDILAKWCVKWVGNKVCILAYLFNFASMKCHEVWALYFSFLHNFKDTVKWSLPFMAVLTGHWLRLNNNLTLACPSLHPLWQIAKPDTKLVSGLMFLSLTFTSNLSQAGLWGLMSVMKSILLQGSVSVYTGREFSL